jgi:hypothetical protein
MNYFNKLAFIVLAMLFSSHGFSANERAGLKFNDVESLALDAYVWAMPLHMSEQSRKMMTGVSEPDTSGGRLKSPMNTAVSAPRLLDPNFKDVVSPNNDTLYAVAWLNVADQPQVIEIPDTKGRYYTFQFVDSYTNNFFYASQLTQVFKQQTYLLTTSDYQGDVPEGMTVIKAPTPTVFVIGRFLVEGESDIANVRDLQKQFTVTALDQFGSQVKPVTHHALENFQAYSGELAFWEEVGDLIQREGLTEVDAKEIARFSALGLSESGFDRELLSQEARLALIAARKNGVGHIKSWLEKMGSQVNGWRLAPVMDEYFGDNFYLRAALADCCLYLNNPGEAYYPPVFTDADNEVLDGSKHPYTLTFPANSLPPVNAFWSVTMYKQHDRLLVENPINRYKLNSEHKDFVFNSDGSLTLYIQKESPGKDKESNWLPAANEPFYMLLRLYQPGEAILTGEYEIPAVIKRDR